MADNNAIYSDFYYIHDPNNDEWHLVMDHPEPPTMDQVKAHFLEGAAQKRRRIQFNQGRLRNIRFELATLEATPLRQPRVIQPTKRNPFSVLDVSDQMAIKAERDAKVARLKAKINEVKDLIRKLENVELRILNFYNTL